MRNLWLLSLLIYGTQAMAADVAPAAEKPVPAVKQHKHHCVGKDGKPCHLSHPVQAAASAVADVQTPVSKEASPAEVKGVKAAAPKTVPETVAVVAVVAAKPEVSAEVALALAKQNNCLACHAIDRKVVCPAWRDVANKYRGDAGAEARLINKIAKGGSGVWGSMAMPAHPNISEADRTTLARFVLNLH